MKFQDYYKILGISQDASKNEIQRAYRKLARKYHPDVNKDKNAEKKIVQINEAYQVLKDPDKKKLYDTYGQNWEQGGSQQPPPGPEKGFSQRPGQQGTGSTFRYSSSENFEDAAGFSEFFNSLFGGGASGGSVRKYGYHEPGRSQEAEIIVSLADVFHGVTKAISLQSYEVDANGQAQPVTKTLHVKIPKGVINGSVIRLAGQGEKGFGQGRAGDLLLRVIIGPDQRFRVDGHDLQTSVAVSPWEAALGAKIPIQVVTGTVNLSIPKGAQTGRKFRLRSKGIPKRKGGAGDLIVEIEVRIPDKLSEDEEKLFVELQKISKFKPRSIKLQWARSYGKA